MRWPTARGRAPGGGEMREGWGERGRGRGREEGSLQLLSIPLELVGGVNRGGSIDGRRRNTEKLAWEEEDDEREGEAVLGRSGLLLGWSWLHASDIECGRERWARPDWGL